MKNIRFLFFLFGLVCILPIKNFACGPDFDSAYFIRMTKQEFLAIPEGHFWIELRRITGDTTTYEIDTAQANRVSDADLQDLKSALQEQNINGKELTDTLTSYRFYRDQITAYLNSFQNDYYTLWYEGGFRRQEQKIDNQNIGKSTTHPQFPHELSDNLPANLPQEFKLYMSGALKYHANDFKGAIADWEKLMELPDTQRKYKTTWATYMLGMAYLSIREQNKAIPYFMKTRELAQKGFHDSLNLSFESYGWQALAEFESNQTIPSIKHYLKQMDVASLAFLCRNISQSSTLSMDSIVHDQTARNVLLGWAVSRPAWNDEEPGGVDPFSNNLIQCIEKLKPSSPITYADRMAWLYYNQGDMTNAHRWLRLSKPPTPLAQYIDYKLTLRDGKINDAIKKLAKAIPAFEQSPDKDMFYEKDIKKVMSSEMAVLKLSRKDYIASFKVILGGEYWEDIAYLAEKVLTTEELESFFDSNTSNPQLSYNKKWFDDFINEGDAKDKAYLKDSLQYLLARRFTRQGKWDKALAYMPPTAKIYYWGSDAGINPVPILTELKTAILKTQDTQFSNHQRAESYYGAATIMRNYGMELMGTELDPDGFIFGGAFSYNETLSHRFALIRNEDKPDYTGDWGKEMLAKTRAIRAKIIKNPGFFYGTKEEEKRVLGSLPSPFKRFHYRYHAADLMWKCAQLLPDNDELKARALCQGGIYLRYIDIKQADKFYKALVKTCPKTDLGQKADKLRWFPDLTD